MTQLYFLRHETHEKIQGDDELEWTCRILKYIGEISSDKIPCNITLKKTMSQSKELTITGKSYAYLEQQSGEIQGITREKKKIKITAHHDNTIHPWLEWSISFDHNKKFKSGMIITHTQKKPQILTNIKRYLTKHTSKNKDETLDLNSMSRSQKDIMKNLNKNYKTLEKFCDKKENKDRRFASENINSEKKLKSWFLNAFIKKLPQYCFSLIKKNIAHLGKIAFSTLIGYFFNHTYIYVILITLLLLNYRILKNKEKYRLSVADITRKSVRIGLECANSIKTTAGKQLKKYLEKTTTKKNEKITAYNTQKRRK